MREYIVTVNETAEYNIIINNDIVTIVTISYNTLDSKREVYKLEEIVDDVIEILKHDKKYLNDFLQYLKQFSPKRYSIKTKTYRREYR
jgi:hypothetical protein